MDKKEQIIYKAISVEDRMPKIANENYLTISKNGFEKPRFYNGTRFETAHYEGDITHWLERETLSQPKEDKDPFKPTPSTTKPLLCFNRTRTYNNQY